MSQSHGLPDDDPLADDTKHYQGDSLYHRTNDGLVTHTKRGKRKTVEAFLTPPSLLLYIWACFPLLLLATATLKAVAIGIIATAINFALIHLDTYASARYIMAGIVTFTVVFLYGEGFL